MADAGAILSGKAQAIPPKLSIRRGRQIEFRRFFYTRCWCESNLLLTACAGVA